MRRELLVAATVLLLAACVPVAKDAVVPDPPPVVVDVPTVVVDAPDPVPTAEPSAPSPAQTGRLTIGDLVDVQVVETIDATGSRTITPETVTDAAEVVRLPGQAATVYALHAGGRAPGTALSVRDGAPTIGPGDLVGLPDGTTAVVTDALVVAKAEAWVAIVPSVTDPHVVIVIACRPTTGWASSPFNVAVIATRTTEESP